jgi:hypothetical protein
MAAAVLALFTLSARAEVAVVSDPAAPPAVRLVGEELQTYLQQLFPTAPIRVRLHDRPEAGDGYVVRAGDQEIVIEGGGVRGLAYGAYALLEKLSCGFYLTGDVLPKPRAELPDLRGVELRDEPLVADRLVFNWHNFLSGCSTWDLPDWQRWIAQARKMRFNAVMVHAYGNNPMVSYAFNGKTKPLGYLSTTARGRDWSTMHVDDVRRLWGGDVFTRPVFGAEAAMAPEEQRAPAARDLMRGAFAFAADRGMNVVFANDVDTVSANPQELILTLPPEARFATTTGKNGTFWLPDPQTAEGYRFYKTQVQALLADYPQITTLAVWFRNGGTPWMDLKLDEMPKAWLEEYDVLIKHDPTLQKAWRSHNVFAIGKIVRAYQRALSDLGLDKRVRVAAGTWHFSFLPAADAFLPPDVPLIGLDYGVLHDQSDLATPERRAALARVGSHRPLIPVIWAQHDDGNYVGRPYTPFPAFHDKLLDCKASGFGIIHWTTRPLDLFFASHARQVWQQTRDEPLGATCDAVAERQLGNRALGAYLERWVTEAPKFARETSDRFIDRPLVDVAATIEGCRQRAAMLDGAPGDGPAYYRGLEDFIAAFHHAQEQVQVAEALWKTGDLAAARAAMESCRPERVIQQYATFSKIGGITRGEQGLLVSLNTRWLPHVIRLRQTLGIEAVRYNFAPTSHDPLAQSPGRFTFHFGKDHGLWQTLGTQETGQAVFAASPDRLSGRDVCDAGIEIDHPFDFLVEPILGARGATATAATLPPGEYRLTLFAADPTSTASGQRVFDVRVEAAPKTAANLAHYEFEPTRAKFVRLACHGNSQNDWNSIAEITCAAMEPGTLQASAEAKGFEAAFAADGKMETRWAARGEDVWLQFGIKSGTSLEAMDVAWYDARQREYRAEFLVSDDGREWRRLPLRPSPATQAAAERVDLFARSRQVGMPVELVFPVKLAGTGTVRMKIVPVDGKAVLCGVVLERLAP